MVICILYGPPTHTHTPHTPLTSHTHTHTHTHIPPHTHTHLLTPTHTPPHTPTHTQNCFPSQGALFPTHLLSLDALLTINNRLENDHVTNQDDQSKLGIYNHYQRPCYYYGSGLGHWVTCSWWIGYSGLQCTKLPNRIKPPDMNSLPIIIVNPKLLS